MRKQPTRRRSLDILGDLCHEALVHQSDEPRNLSAYLGEPRKNQGVLHHSHQVVHVLCGLLDLVRSSLGSGSADLLVEDFVLVVDVGDVGAIQSESGNISVDHLLGSLVEVVHDQLTVLGCDEGHDVQFRRFLEDSTRALEQVVDRSG